MGTAVGCRDWWVKEALVLANDGVDPRQRLERKRRPFTVTVLSLFHYNQLSTPPLAICQRR